MKKRTHKVCPNPECRLAGVAQPVYNYHWKNKAKGIRQPRCADCCSIRQQRLYAMPGRKEYVKQQHAAARLLPGVIIRTAARNKRYVDSPEGLARYLYNNAQKRALKKNMRFNITVEHVLSVMPEPFVCPLLEITMQRGIGKPISNSPTLDRINPNLGYVLGNVAIISFKANTMKYTATADEIITVGRNLKRLTGA